MPHLLHTSSLIAMRKRREFLMVRDRGVKQVTPFFILQACRARDDGPRILGSRRLRKRAMRCVAIARAGGCDPCFARLFCQMPYRGMIIALWRATTQLMPPGIPYVMR